MKTYNVKQISEMLNTNPETVRRWIRDKKLKAVQSSKKDGNVITDTELQRFLKTTPKYLSKMSVGIAAISPVVGITTFAIGVVMDYLREKGDEEIKILPEDLKKYLQKSIVEMQKTAEKKQELIKQTQGEINKLEKRIEQYKYILENKEAMQSAIDKVELSK